MLPWQTFSECVGSLEPMNPEEAIMQQKSGIFHVHLFVRDIARSIRFYREVFGMTVLDFHDAELPQLVFLSTPGQTDLLTLNPDSNMQSVAGENGGVEHFGIKLPDADLN